MTILYDSQESSEIIPTDFCWICCRKYDEVSLSLCPKSYGNHHNPDSTKWTNAHKRHGKLYTYPNCEIIDDFTNELCAPICWHCAH
mgnify:CR=1 FL=1